jgi:hypothetical protein
VEGVEAIRTQRDLYLLYLVNRFCVGVVHDGMRGGQNHIISSICFAVRRASRAFLLLIHHLCGWMEFFA